jgi:tetratricopeptide (TPR) repeat protein
MAKVALLVGVSEYQSGFQVLPAATKDVEAVREVLQNPSIGGFESTEITTLPNPDPQQMRETLVSLFRDRQKSDVLLFYFSGHGVTDDRGTFYLTCAQTKPELLEATAIPADFVHQLMENSRSKQQIIVLDCCFSGAFARGMGVKGTAVNLAAQLGGQGRAVLTSSSATEYSFEQKEADLSVYTRYWVEGLQTGAADEDGNGWISIDELHGYASRKVRESAPAMKPQIYAAEEGYKIILAQAPIGDPQLEYRKEVERLAQERKGQLSQIIQDALDEKRKTLALSVENAQAIQNEVLKPYRELEENLQRYEQAVNSALQLGHIFSQTTLEDLSYLQQALGLRDADVAAINSKIPASLMLRMKRALNTWNFIPNQPASQQRRFPRLVRRLQPDRETVRPKTNSVAERKNAKAPILLGSAIAVAIGGIVALPSLWNSKIEPFPTLRTVVPWFGGKRHPYLGIQMTSLTPDVKQKWNSDPNSPVTVQEDKGVLVEQVMPDLSAAKAGIQVGDVIQKIADQPVTDADSVQKVVEASQIGKNLSIELQRNGQPVNLSVQLGGVPEQNYLFDQGLAKYNEGNYEGAIAKYNEAIGLQSDYAEAYYNRGLTKYALGDKQGAIADYDEAIGLKQDYAEAYNNRGIVKADLDDKQGAIKDYDQAIQINQNWGDLGLWAAYNDRGNAKVDLGKNQEAIADFDKAIDLKQDFAEAYYNRGFAKADLGKNQEAIADYDKAIGLQSDYAAAYNNRGLAKAALGKNQEAIADYTKSIELKNPLLYLPYNNRGLAKYALGKNQEAIADFDKAIDLKQDYAEAYYNRGNAKYALGKNQEAIADFDKAIGLNPNDAEAYNNRGVAKYALGKKQEAIADYDKAIGLNPNDAEAYYNRGNAKYALGKKQEAIADYREAARLFQQQGNTELNRDALNQIEKLGK